MSRLRLQSWATNGKGHYTVNLDGVPLGCVEMVPLDEMVREVRP